MARFARHRARFARHRARFARANTREHMGGLLLNIPYNRI